MTRKELYNCVNVIKFNYFNFDLITCKKYFEYIKAFKNIKKLHFNYNNIYSLYQLIKLECFENLENLNIVNNEISCSEKFVKLFIIYRMDTIEIYNNEFIKYDERVLSNKIFNTFDSLILLNENRIKNEQKNKLIEEEKKNNICNDDPSDNDIENKFIIIYFNSIHSIYDK